MYQLVVDARVLFNTDSLPCQIFNYAIFIKGADRAVLLEMDHEAKEVFVEELRTLQEEQVARRLMVPSDDAVVSRLTSPIVHTYVDTGKISFER